VKAVIFDFSGTLFRCEETAGWLRATLAGAGIEASEEEIAHYGLDGLVAGYLLSYEQGIQKPDPEIFRRACDLLGHDPADVLMVGDNAIADGAATAIGCAFRLVPHLPVSERPAALLEAVS